MYSTDKYGRIKNHVKLVKTNMFWSLSLYCSSIDWIKLECSQSEANIQYLWKAALTKTNNSLTRLALSCTTTKLSLPLYINCARLTDDNEKNQLRAREIRKWMNDKFPTSYIFSYTGKPSVLNREVTQNKLRILNINWKFETSIERLSHNDARNLPSILSPFWGRIFIRSRKVTKLISIFYLWGVPMRCEEFWFIWGFLWK